MHISLFFFLISSFNFTLYESKPTHNTANSKFNIKHRYYLKRVGEDKDNNNNHDGYQLEYPLNVLIRIFFFYYLLNRNHTCMCPYCTLSSYLFSFFYSALNVIDLCICCSKCIRLPIKLQNKCNQGVSNSRSSPWNSQVVILIVILLGSRAIIQCMQRNGERT